MPSCPRTRVQETSLGYVSGTRVQKTSLGHVSERRPRDACLGDVSERRLREQSLGDVPYRPPAAVPGPPRGGGSRGGRNDQKPQKSIFSNFESVTIESGVVGFGGVIPSRSQIYSFLVFFVQKN